eukprot:SAG11_NODE_1377_length_5084_cov_3.764092_3_plen_658_part_00
MTQKNRRALGLAALKLLLVCILLTKMIEAKKKRNSSKKNKENRTEGNADSRRHWDKSGDGSDGKDYWGMPNPNPGWDKYYGGKCDELLKCAEAGNNECLSQSAIPLCNLELQETDLDKNVLAQGLGLAAAAGHVSTVELFVRFPTKWWNKNMVVNEVGETVLMHAAANGQYDVVEWLLNEGADVRVRSPNGETAEDLARTSDSPGETLAIIQRFADEATQKMLGRLAKGLALDETQFTAAMASGAVVNTPENSTGLTAVALASKFGMADMVKLLAQNGADLNWRDERSGHAVIHMGCDRGHFNVVLNLLEYGASPSATTDHFDMDCLMLAAMNGRNGLVQMMLEHGKAYPDQRADPARTNFEGENALLMFVRQMYGAGAGQARVVKLLIDGGSDVNAAGADGSSALFYAIDHSQFQSMELLVQAGAGTASVSTDAEDGDRPVGAFEQSIRSGCRECAAWLISNGHREEFKYTKVRGGARGATALFSVMMLGWDDVSEALLNDGAGVNEQNLDGSTPLFAAALKGSKSGVELLLKRGADLEALNVEGDTALLVAADHGKAESVIALVAAGAKVDARDRSQATPLFRAAMNGHQAAVRELLKAGADPKLQGWANPGSSRRTRGRAGMAKLDSAAGIARRHGFSAVAALIEKWSDEQDLL